MRARRLSSPAIFHDFGYLIRRSGEDTVGVLLIDASHGTDIAKTYLTAVAEVVEIHLSAIDPHQVDFFLASFGLDEQAAGQMRKSLSLCLPGPRKFKKSVYADRVSARLVERVRSLRQSHLSLRAISQILTSEGWTSARSRPLSHGSVAFILKRAAMAKSSAPARRAVREPREPMPWC